MSLLSGFTVTLASTLCATALCACAVGPNYKRPSAAGAEHYKNLAPPTAPPQAIPDQWWTVFQDDTLNELIPQVDVSNQNLAQSIAAYAQAEAVVRQARATFFPVITANASATRVTSGSRGGGTTVGSTPVVTSGSAPSGTATSTNPNGTITTTLYQVQGTGNWQLDVFGKLRRTLENARETSQADLADLASARLAAQQQLATAYLQLRGADAERRLLTASAEAYGRTLEITQNRYRVGTAPKTDVLQAETQFYNAEQQEAAMRLQRAQLEDAIAVLVGKPASDFKLAEQDDWHIPIPEVPVGVPSTLLERRPDIVAAERLAAAANANIGVQEAAYFPDLTLTGTIGYLSSTVSRLFESANVTREVALSASQTVLDFGATRAKVSQARAQYQQSVASYRQTVLTALQGVENDLAAADWDKKQYELIKKSSEAADESERLTLNEYKAGTVDYTTVVVAQTAALSARLTLAQVTVSEQTTAVSLMADLGGGWTPAGQPPPENKP
jgi:NodT family efflux transporter outer membrane factor (OMF) lipoprotein